MKKIVLLSLLIFGLLGLLKIFSIVPFNRMAGDDYSSAIVGKDGLLRAVIFTYNSSMGRFSAPLIETPFSTGLAEKGNIMIYSIITFSTLFICLALFIKRFLNLKFTNVYLYILPAVLIACFYQLTPNKSESWYWLTGSVVYLWPIILSLIAFSYLFKKKQTSILLPAVFTFFSTAGNEAFGLITVSALAFVLFLLKDDKKRKKLVVYMLVASILSFLIMALAPGNSHRMTGYGSNPMSLPGSIFYSISEGPALYFKLIIQNAYIIIPLMVLFPFVFFLLNSRQTLKKPDLDTLLFKIFITFIFGLALSAVFMLPAFVGLGRVQPERSALTVAFILVGQLVFISYFLSKLLSNKIASGSTYKIVVFLACITLVISSSVFTKTFAQDVYTAKNYSKEFDAMILNFRRIAKSDNPDREIEVSLPEHGLIAELLDPPGKYTYKNLSLSQYFKIGKVITKEYEQ